MGRLAVAVAALSLALAGPSTLLACAGASTGRQQPIEPTQPLTTREQALFNRGVGPSVLGVVPPRPPAEDDVYIARLVEADSVVLARVVTVHQVGLSEGGAVQFDIEPRELLLGSAFTQPLVLEVGHDSPLFDGLQSVSGQLIGQDVLVALVVRGGQTLWHVEAWNDEARAAVERAKTLDDLRR